MAVLIRNIRRRSSNIFSSPLHQCRDPIVWRHCTDMEHSDFPSLIKPSLFVRGRTYIACTNQRSYKLITTLSGAPFECSPFRTLLLKGLSMFLPYKKHLTLLHLRYMSGSSLEVTMDKDVVRFSIGKHHQRPMDAKEWTNKQRRFKMSRKAKLNELRFYRLKAKKKMKSPNPEVRILYRLGKAKRKEEWLIEKLRKYEVPKTPAETYDPEILTEEEKFYLKRTGEKKKNYVPVGRRGVFGGVVLNMHLHWKNHETVKVVCKPCRPGQVHIYAEELARLSKGIVIDIKPDNTIIFYRGKNYVRPEVMSPSDTLSKAKALEKYKYEQSLEHTSQFIEKLERELEEYYEHRDTQNRMILKWFSLMVSALLNSTSGEREEDG